MFFLVFNGVLLFTILLLLLLLSGIWPPDSPWAPWWQMPKETIYKMCTMAKINKESVIYDLGSGTGNALIIAAKEFEAKGVGIEIDPLRYYISQFNRKRHHVEGKVTFIKQNFFSISLSDATVIFMYLIPAALKRLTPKFLKEVKPGTVFISYKYEMPLSLFHKRLKLIKNDDNHEIFMYMMMK